MKTSILFKLSSLLVIVVIGMTTLTMAQDPEARFQQGLIKEEGEGSLLEAIDIYSEIAENESADRALRAKALLRRALL